MAVSKTTTRKTTTKRATKAKAVEAVETVEATEVVEPKPTARPKKRLEINRDELIVCRSATENLVYVSNRTGEKFEWADFGDVQYITLGELISMKSTQPRFLKEGWLIVDDEEVIEQLGLAKMYGSIFEVDDIDDFLEQDPYEMERILKTMPRGFKNSIAQVAREKVESGELDSNRKIKLLEQLLDVDLKIFE